MASTSGEPASRPRRRLSVAALGVALGLSYAAPAPAWADDVPDQVASAVGAYVESLPTATGSTTSESAAEQLGRVASEQPVATTAAPETVPDAAQQPESAVVGGDHPDARLVAAELPPAPGLADAAGASLDAIGGARLLVTGAVLLGVAILAIRASLSARRA